MKYSEPFFIYFSCQTTAGHRYIYYTDSDTNLLDKGEYVHYGLGRDTVKNEWRTVRRDLQQDLQKAQPGNKIISVDAFLVRGSGLVDDICSIKYTDSDRDLIPDGVETVYGLNPNDSSDAELDIDNDGISNVKEFMNDTDMTKDDTDDDGLTDKEEIDITLTSPVLADTDNNNIPDGNEDPDNDGLSNIQELSMGFEPYKTTYYDNTNKLYYEQTVLEDGDSANIAAWSVYDKSPKGKISIITDPSDFDNSVISFRGGKTKTGYRLIFKNPITFSLQSPVNGLQSNFSWRMKYSEPFVIYFSCQTAKGHRYIYYTNSDTDLLDRGGYVHHGLGADTVNGDWISVSRNLQSDLNEAQPGNKIISIDAFLVRGSGMIDDIISLKYQNQ